MKTPRMSRFGKTATLATLVALCVATGLFGTQERAEGWGSGRPYWPLIRIPADGGAHGRMAENVVDWVQADYGLAINTYEAELIRDGASAPDSIWNPWQWLPDWVPGGATQLTYWGDGAKQLQTMIGRTIVYCDLQGCYCVDQLCFTLKDDWENDYDKLAVHEWFMWRYWADKAKDELSTNRSRAMIHLGYAMHFAQDYLSPAHLDGWGWKQTLWEVKDYNFIPKAEAEFDLFGRCFASYSDVRTRITNDLDSYRRYNKVLWPIPPKATWIDDQASEYVPLDGRIKGAVNWSEQVSLEILQYVFGLLQPPEGCVFSSNTPVAYVYSSWGTVALADEINKMDVLEPGEYGFATYYDGPTTYYESNIEALWPNLYQYEVLLIDEASFYVDPEWSEIGGPIYDSFTNSSHASALKRFVKKGGGIFTTGGNDLERIRTWNWLPPGMRVTSYGHERPSQSGVHIVYNPGLYSWPNPDINDKYLSGAHPGGSNTHTWFTSKSPGYIDTVRRNDHGPGHKRTVELVGYFGSGVIVASEVEAEAGDARYYLQNMLNFLKPSRSFGLEFLSPQSGGSFLVGQEVPLLVAARDAAGNPASGATVTLNSPTGEPIPLTEMTDSPGIYQATYTISPTDPIEEWVIGVVGSVGGELPKQAISVQISETPSLRLGLGGHIPWDVAVNPDTNRIYTANAGSSNVSVIDGASNTVVDTVAVGDYPYGVAVNPDTNRIYVANSDSDNVSVIDGASNTVVDTVAVGDYPYGVAVNPTTNRIYVTNNWGDSVSVIDGASNTVVGTVGVGTTPGMTPPVPLGVAVNPNTNRIYVTNADNAGGPNSVFVIDGASNTVVATISAEYYPADVAVNPNTNRIYVANTGPDSVSVIDGATNTIAATVAMEMEQDPYGVAVNPDTNRIYVANVSSSSVSVIDGTSNTVVATLTVGRCPGHVAVNPSTNRTYVVNACSDSVSVIDGASNTVVATITDRWWWHVVGVAVNPNTNRIYVADNRSNSVSVIDGASNTVVATITEGHDWVWDVAGVAVNPNTNLVYVADGFFDNVFVIDGFSNTVVTTVAVLHYPADVAVNPNTNRIYVAHHWGNIVSVIDGGSNTVVATVALGYEHEPRYVAINPNTNLIYVTHSVNWAHDNVSVIDGASNTVVATIAMGDHLRGMAVNPNTNRIYVANVSSSSVSVIDGATNTVVDTVGVGDYPYGVALNPNTNCIYVTNYDDDTVSLIGNCPNPNVPEGSSVTVDLNGGLGSVGGMEATFSNVMASGDTSVDVGSSGPPAPTGYQVVGIAGQPAYFDMNTTADFSGPIAVCIAYDETQVTAPESELKLMHYVGEEFVDITGFVEPEGNVICGETTSLSPFVVVEPTGTPTPDSDGDGCTWAQEGAMGFDDTRWYDFYDVPVPALADPASNGPRNQAVTIADVLAVLFYVGTYDGDGGTPNANGVAYDSVKNSCDLDGDTVMAKEGLCYDRSPGVEPNPPWDAGPPNGAVNIQDVLAVLAQVGLDCSGPP